MTIKASIKSEKLINLEISEPDAKILLNTFGSKTGEECERFYGKTGFEKLVYLLYDELKKVV